MALDYDPTLRTLGCGYLYPYNERTPANMAEQIANAILYDLNDRKGIKHGFAGVDLDVREEIVQRLSEIIVCGLTLQVDIRQHMEQPLRPASHEEMMADLRARFAAKR